MYFSFATSLVCIYIGYDLSAMADDSATVDIILVLNYLAYFWIK